MTSLEQISSGSGVTYDDSKPALLFGGAGKFVADAFEILPDAGVRLVDRLTVAEGVERLRFQPSLGLAWVELGLDDLGPDLERLVDQLEERASVQGTAVVVSAPEV